MRSTGFAVALRLACCLLATASLPALAEPSGDEGAALRPVAEQALARIAPQLAIEAVRPSPMPGLIEVEAGNQLFYLSADGRHLLQGNLIDTVERVDLSERRRQQTRSALLRDLPEAQTIAFGAPEAQHRVTVFTALDCGYCRRFHADIAEYLEAGISVDYVLLPLAGEGSEADRTGARLFCAADRQDAFTRATRGEPIEGPMCDADTGYSAGKALAARLGIRNTPTIVRADGSVSGYQTPAELRASLASLAQVP